MPQCILGNVKIHAEIPILLLFFAFMLESSVTTNLIIYRTCYLTLGFNKSECALLGTNHNDNATAELEKKVQTYADVYIMCRSVIEATIAPVLCFFLGSWSDKYGRKPILLASCGGYIFSYLIMTAISALPNVSIWFLLLNFVPVCLTGGFSALLTSLLSYISDVTSNEMKGVRMGIFEAVLTLGVLLGSSSSAFVFNAFGYIIVYSICTICVFLAWLFILFLMPESVSNIETQGKLRNLFAFSLAKETIQTTFKRRENHNRALLLIIISLMVIFLTVNLGDSGVLFLYLREKFQWSLKRFTIFVAINNMTSIIGSILGAYVLNKLLKVRETIVILLGLLSYLFTSILQGLATKDWQIYTAGNSRCLAGAVNPMARSLLTKLIPTEETGQVFAVVTALQTMIGFLGTPVYTLIYNSTLLTIPGLFNFVTAGILGIEVILTIIIFIIQRRQRPMLYNVLGNEGSIN